MEDGAYTVVSLSLTVQSLTAGKHETADHITSLGRKQNTSNAGAQFAFSLKYNL